MRDSATKQKQIKHNNKKKWTQETILKVVPWPPHGVHTGVHPQKPTHMKDEGVVKEDLPSEEALWAFLTFI